MDTGSAAPAVDLTAGHPGLLVFADDGEPAADAAWSWITSHDWKGWHLEIVTVRETLSPGGRSIGHARHVERRPPAEARFTVSVHSDDEGDPRTVLLRRAAEALVVVGCHHRSHWSALWAGSTTEWLIVGTPFPLLVARHGHPSRTVAICVDGSIHARKALEAFMALPWHADVDVVLVAVDDGAVDVEAALTEAATALGRKEVPMARPAGAAKRAIPRYVRENGIDLVVVGTRGLTGIRRMAIGSTVAALLKDATANLLIAHVDEGLDEL